MRIHHLVAQTFIDSRRGRIVNHKDGDKQNNYYKNLEWTDYSGNNRHAISIGLRRGRLTVKDHKKINKMNRRNISGRSISRKFGVSHTLIQEVLKGNVLPYD